jgi:preprotein translocase subunit Sec63
VLDSTESIYLLVMYSLFLVVFAVALKSVGLGIGVDEP